jgi:hypothetical protein
MTKVILLLLIFSGCAAQRGLWPPRHTRFLDHSRRATVGRTPLGRVNKKITVSKYQAPV